MSIIICLTLWYVLSVLAVGGIIRHWAAGQQAYHPPDNLEPYFSLASGNDQGYSTDFTVNATGEVTLN